MVDLTGVIGEPFEYITEEIYIQETGEIVELEKQVVNPEFIINFALLLFLTIFLSNLILRTFFRKR